MLIIDLSACLSNEMGTVAFTVCTSPLKSSLGHFSVTEIYENLFTKIRFWFNCLCKSSVSTSVDTSIATSELNIVY